MSWLLPCILNYLFYLLVMFALQMCICTDELETAKAKMARITLISNLEAMKKDTEAQQSGFRHALNDAGWRMSAVYIQT